MGRQKTSVFMEEETSSLEMRLPCKISTHLPSKSQDLVRANFSRGVCESLYPQLQSATC